MNIIPDFLEFQQEFVDEWEIDMLNYDFYATIYNIICLLLNSLFMRSTHLSQGHCMEDQAKTQDVLVLQACEQNDCLLL